jgi:sulfur carrier protein
MLGVSAKGRLRVRKKTGQPSEPDPDSAGVGKRESHGPDIFGTSLRPYSLATGRGQAECGFFICPMNVQVNGEKKEIKEGLSVADLLAELEIRPGRVVVELNRDIVARDAHGATLLKEGDTVEIVHFVGGG